MYIYIALHCRHPCFFCLKHNCTVNTIHTCNYRLYDHVIGITILTSTALVSSGPPCATSSMSCVCVCVCVCDCVCAVCVRCKGELRVCCQGQLVMQALAGDARAAVVTATCKPPTVAASSAASGSRAALVNETRSLGVLRMCVFVCSCILCVCCVLYTTPDH